MKLGQALYEQDQANNERHDTPETEKAEGDNVVDAEFQEIDDQDKK